MDTPAAGRTHRIFPLAVTFDGLKDFFLTAETEALDGFGYTSQRAEDLLRVHVLSVVLQHTVNTQRGVTPHTPISTHNTTQDGHTAYGRDESAAKAK